MAYRLRYTFNVDWIGPGPIGAAADGQSVGAKNTNGGQCSQTFTSTDITNMTNGAAADMVAQLTAVQARVQAWATGALGANVDSGAGGQ